MRQYVYIIEVKFADRRPKRDWEPTVGCALGLEDAGLQLADWKKNCPDEEFRIHRYNAATD